MRIGSPTCRKEGEDGYQEGENGDSRLYVTVLALQVAQISYLTTDDTDAPAETVDYLSLGYDTQGRLETAQVYGPGMEKE